MASDVTPPRPFLTPEQLEGLFEHRRQHEADDAGFAGTANRRFVRLTCNPSRRWPGVEWINQPEGGRYYHLLGLGHGWQPYPMGDAPTPRFRTRSRKASNLADLCEFSSTWWLLASARFAEVLARMQPEAVDILPVEVQLGDGTVLPAGDYAMVDVVNVLPAYDRAASGLEAMATDSYGRPYIPKGHGRIILRERVVAGHHLFRDEVDRLRLWVSIEVRDALRQAQVTSATYDWPDRNNLGEFDG
jgi:hypothetical protein